MVMKFGQFMYHYKINFFIKKSKGASMLIAFDSFAIAYLQKFHFPIEFVLNSLQAKKTWN